MKEKYLRTSNFAPEFIKDNLMGPNAMKLTEELLAMRVLPQKALVLDLGCGKGLSSILMAKEYGWKVIAADLWIEPTENHKRFESLGLTWDQIMPVKAEAHALPFASDYFDIVVSVDAYQYFGSVQGYLDTHLLPIVKPGGLIMIAVPGVKEELTDRVPDEMLLSWEKEDLSTFHSVGYWRALLSSSEGIDSVDVQEMDGFEECWQDWLDCDNPHAVGDRPAMEAGAGSYMNFVAMILKKSDV